MLKITFSTKMASLSVVGSRLIASLSLLLLLLQAFAGLPTSAQSYHYSYGSSRVVNQNQTGLYMPSSTYIGSGTMSRSAQGLKAGVSSGGLQGLPQTNFGATVTTPGDNQYTDAVQYQRRFGRRSRMPVARMGAFVGQPGDNMRSDLHPYIPGQNAHNQHPGASGAAQQEGGGASTYAEPNYSVNRAGAFSYN
jgi:hypothetical protein